MAKNKTFENVMVDFLKSPVKNYKVCITYTDGTDDFDRYDEMNACDVYCSTAEEALANLIKFVERGGLENYTITDIPHGIKYKDVSSFIADYIPVNNKLDYWTKFARLGIDIEGCNSHICKTKTEDVDKGTSDEEGYYKLVIDPSTSTEVLRDTYDMLQYLLREDNAAEYDKLLIEAFHDMVGNILSLREKRQKEDEDYQLYLKLKERFEGGK